jgi:hypothetical protein
MIYSELFLTEARSTQRTRRRRKGENTGLKAYLSVKSIDYEQFRVKKKKNEIKS